MGHSLGDGIIVAALAAAFLGYFYIKHLDRRRRLEIIHQERMAAMDKGIPLPELPLDPPAVVRSPDRRAPLVHGIVWTSLGAGAMLALWFVQTMAFPQGPGLHHPTLWPLPLPLTFLGIGLLLFYFLAARRD